LLLITRILERSRVLAPGDAGGLKQRYDEDKVQIVATNGDFMLVASPSNPQRERPLLFEGLTWREFKAVEQLPDRPGYRLSFLDGVLEIVQMPGSITKQ
jgi:hypothetical protein